MPGRNDDASNQTQKNGPEEVEPKGKCETNGPATADRFAINVIDQATSNAIVTLKYEGGMRAITQVHLPKVLQNPIQTSEAPNKKTRSGGERGRDHRHYS